MTFGCFNEQRTTQRERALMWVLSISCHLSLSITVGHCGKRIVRTMLLQSELFQTFTVMKVMNVMKVMKVKVTAEHRTFDDFQFKHFKVLVEEDVVFLKT